MKLIKSTVLVIILLVGFKCGEKIQHKLAVHKSTEVNVVVEGWGTTDSFFGPEKSSWVGSGVIVDSNGLVITAKHCLKDADKIRVTLYDGRQFTIYSWAESKTDDFGYFYLPVKPTKYKTLADSSKIKSKTRIYNVGNAFGLLDGAVSEGVVVKNNFSRCFLEDNGRKFIFADLIVQKGCSGGGVYTYNGKLIGIIVMSGNGFSFIVPSEIILEMAYP